MASIYIFNIKSISMLKGIDIFSKAQEEEKDIDLSIFLNSIFRNKIFIGSVTTFFFISSCIFALTKKRSYEGQFQILLKINQAPSLSSVSPTLSRFAGINLNQNNNIKTEIGILKSPSVLKTSFDYILSKKKLDNNQKLTFQEWLKKLRFSIVDDDTNILNISYRDQNKEIILPALEKISKTYQEYSNRNKKKSRKLTIDYLTNQILLYKKKSSNSFRIAQEYAAEKDLVYGELKLEKQIDETQKSDVFFPNTDIEVTRANAAYAVKEIDSTINKINEIDNVDDSFKLIYIASQISSPKINELLNLDQFTLMDEKLDSLRSKYKSNDLLLINLLEKKERSFLLLKKRLLDYFKSLKLSQESIVESATRPKEVLIKYKELIRDAARDELTLVNLENELRKNNLMDAKKDEPWELITQPYLNEKPVPRNSLLIALIGTIFGFFLSSIIALFKDQKSAFIKDEKVLENLFKAKVLERINLSNKSIEKYNTENFIYQIFMSIEKDKLKLYFSNDLSNNDKKDFLNLFPEEFIISEVQQNLLNLKKDDKVILITSIGKITKQEAITINNKLNLFENAFSGILLIEKDNLKE